VHADRDAVHAQRTEEVIASELTALIGVEDLRSTLCSGRNGPQKPQEPENVIREALDPSDGISINARDGDSAGQH
jgi:hypothetical protein